VGDDLIPDGSATSITALNSADSIALALYAIDAINWASLTLTPGVRVELIESSFDDRLSGESSSRWAHGILPGVGAFYALTDDFGVLAGVYRGFSPPAPGSDEDVEPELSVNYEAGARFDHERYRIELIGFYNDYTNLTDVCTLSSGCIDADLDRQFDAGSARIYGLEAFAGIAPQAGPLTLPVVLAYTLTQTEFRTSFDSEDPIFGDVEEGDEMPYVPPHQLTASIGVEHKVAGGSINAMYVAAMREQAGSEPIEDTLHTDEYFVMDVDAQLRLIEHLEIYVSVRNLLDASYIVARRPYGARPNVPRWIQVGTKLTF
jgi:Fe(3+) dicitrate transport protein